MDSLPPGPARQSEIITYLATLIGWLNTDPWPRDRRFSGPVLTPAAIKRKLKVKAATREGEEDIDADVLALQCQRLVILGGPGSGKTWLASVSPGGVLRMLYSTSRLEVASTRSSCRSIPPVRVCIALLVIFDTPQCQAPLTRSLILVDRELMRPFMTFSPNGTLQPCW